MFAGGTLVWGPDRCGTPSRGTFPRGLVDPIATYIEAAGAALPRRTVDTAVLPPAPVRFRPFEQRAYASKCVRTLGSWDSEATTEAAMSRSLTFRVLEAFFRILMAVSWLQRFCAMMAPVARSIMVRDSMAAVGGLVYAPKDFQAVLRPRGEISIWTL